MTDMTNPRARLDAALEEMRSTLGSSSQPVRLTAEATVACAEALSLLVDAQVAATAPEPEPAEPDPREPLPDDTPVGHGWVVAWTAHATGLHKPYGNGRFTWWLSADREWGAEGYWRDSELSNPRPATVGDLRRLGVPVAEWPDITAPEPEPPHAEQAQAAAERDNAIAALRAARYQMALGATHGNQSQDTRRAFRESVKIVETEARRRGIDLSEEGP